MDTTGVILAGGKSQRMRFNKAFAKLNDKPLIEIILDKFKAFFAETLIISNIPEFYQHYGVGVYRDVYPGLGPVSGIHAGLTYAKNPRLFVVACDMPFVQMDLVAYMLDELQGFQAVVVNINGYPQATGAVYSRECLDVFTNCIRADKLKAGLIFRELRTRVLKPDDLVRFGNVEEIFYNINDETDLVYARELAGRYLE